MAETIDLFQFSYKTLRDKFVEKFNVNHLTLDLLNVLEEVDFDEASIFIIDNFKNEFTDEGLKEIFKGF